MKTVRGVSFKMVRTYHDRNRESGIHFFDFQSSKFETLLVILNDFYFFTLVLINILRRNKLIWHGSFPDGRRDPSKYCDGWRSSSSSNTGFASDLRYVTVKIAI